MSAEIRIYSLEPNNFCYIKKHRPNDIFSDFFDFYWNFKGCSVAWGKLRHFVNESTAS